MSVPEPLTYPDRQTASSVATSATQTPSCPGPLDRAQTHAAIFLNAGDRWRNYVPVDATVDGDTVYLQGVRMERSGNGWRLETNGQAWVVRAKASD
jgi:endonuclease YncB( thermonuclease family)